MSGHYKLVCVSWFSIQVALLMVIKSWNDHRIPGYFIRYFNYRQGNSKPTDEGEHFHWSCSSIIPSTPTEDAVQLYHSSGGKLNLCSSFGNNPPHGNTTLRKEIDTFRPTYQTSKEFSIRL